MDLHFESSTQERFILSYLIKDRQFFLKIGKLLKTSDYNRKSYFQDSKLQWILNACCVYYDKFSRVPTLETINMICEHKFKDDALMTKAIKSCIDEIYKKDLSEVEPEYIKNETISFVRTMKAVEATLQNEIDISNGKFDELSDRIRDAININLDKDFGVSLANIDDTIDLIQEVEQDTGLTFGIPTIDRDVGCPRSGELYVYGGVSGIGKTIHLGHIATENVKLGKKGVFFTLEVDKRRLAKRLYSSLLMKTGMEVSSISKEEARSIFEGYGGGDLRIKQYDANTACCNDFENFIMDLYTIEGYKPDFVVIDYILITNTNKNSDEANSYAKFKLVSEEMRNLARHLNVPVFSAVQLNRSGYADKGCGTKALSSIKDIAESKGIIDTSEAVILINQTDQDKKLGEKDGIAEQKLMIAKSRNGKAGGIIPVVIDYNTMTITEGTKQRKTV